jgi:hypothetical protein
VKLIDNYVNGDARVEHLQIKVNYRMDMPAGWDAWWANSALWKSVNITAVPKNGSSSNQWGSNSLPANPASVPITGASTTPFDMRPPVCCKDGTVETWSIGQLGQFGVDGTTQTWNSSGVASTIPRRSMERTLEDKVVTAAGVNDLDIGINFESGSLNPQLPKYVFVDSVEVTAEYRKARTLRPLRGCLTTRLGYRSTTDFPNNAVTSDATPWDFGWIKNGLPFTDESAARSSGSLDQDSCPLLRTNPGPKLHVRGSIFAPTAALDLSGNDNDAPFVTGGIVVRNLTAWRYKNGGNIPAFGTGSDYIRAPREFTLTATDSNGQVLRQKRVKLIDSYVNGVLANTRVKIVWTRVRGGAR